MFARKSLLLTLLSVSAFCLAAAAEDKVIFRKGSADGTILVTEDEQGLRTLRFGEGGARQSVVKPGDPDHLELRYARVMPLGLALVERPRRVLIVGLGGGTIPSFLHKHFPKIVIDVVEIDADVVDVARRFFEFREDATMHAHVDDGRRFIERRRHLYDIIFLDAFGSDSIPYSLATREFLQAVRKSLTPGGVVVGNVWSRHSNRLYDSMVRTYQDVFAELYIVDVPGVGNKILLALPDKRKIGKVELTRRAAEISRLNQFGFDLGQCVKSGFRRPGEDGVRGRVLKDADQRRKAE